MRPAAPSKSQPKQRQSSQKPDVSASGDQDQTGKENKRVGVSKAKGKTSTVQRKSRKREYCVCKQPDDGTPMVRCSECKDW
jgi:hypothetical protein